MKKKIFGRTRENFRQPVATIISLLLFVQDFDFLAEFRGIEEEKIFWSRASKYWTHPRLREHGIIVVSRVFTVGRAFFLSDSGSRKILRKFPKFDQVPL